MPGFQVAETGDRFRRARHSHIHFYTSSETYAQYVNEDIED